MPEEGKNKNDKWITVKGNGKTKNTQSQTQTQIT
jgi:hypothetical protein